MFPELKLISDEDLNDSDKIVFTVPDGEVYEVLWIHVEYAASADAGNRALNVQFRDADDDVVLQRYMGEAITVSETWHCLFAPGVPLQEDEAGVGIKQAYVPLPTPMMLPAGFDLRITDSSAVAAAADDMVVHALVRRRQVG